MGRLAERLPVIRCLDWIVRIGLAGLFLYAGALKLRDPGKFVGEIENYRLLSESWSMRAGYYVPWLEIVAALALLAKWPRLGGWLLTAGLAAGFTVFVTSAWIRGLDISCGCFGASSGAAGPGATLRAGGILVLACAGLRYEIQRQAAAGGRRPSA